MITTQIIQLKSCTAEANQTRAMSRQADMHSVVNTPSLRVECGCTLKCTQCSQRRTNSNSPPKAHSLRLLIHKCPMSIVDPPGVVTSIPTMLSKTSTISPSAALRLHHPPPSDSCHLLQSRGRKDQLHQGLHLHPGLKFVQNLFFRVSPRLHCHPLL